MGLRILLKLSPSEESVLAMASSVAKIPEEKAQIENIRRLLLERRVMLQRLLDIQEVILNESGAVAWEGSGEPILSN